MIVFDLDGTLADSKQAISKEMAVKLLKLLRRTEVAIISGCKLEQMKEQVTGRIIAKLTLDNYMDICEVHLLPTSGCEYWKIKPTLGEDFTYFNEYTSILTLVDKVNIYNAWEDSVRLVGGWSSKIVGEIAEDRGSQITFSMCGQEAPLELKSQYDPDQVKRKRIVKEMKEKIPEYSIRIGGTSSIDVNKKGSDKKSGLLKFLHHIGKKQSEVTFVGDALYEGGNDAPVLELEGVTCIETSGPKETLEIIDNLLDTLDK